MRPRLSLADPANVAALEARLERLRPDTSRRWGTLSPHEMLCHLSDSFAGTLGDRHISPRESWWSRHVMKWVALHTTLAWPPGVPTRPEVDPRRAGTPPVEFAADKAGTLRYLRRFVQPDAAYGRHPVFGAMSREEWLLWGFAHVDHHLRQFGL